MNHQIFAFNKSFHEKITIRIEKIVVPSYNSNHKLLQLYAVLVFEWIGIQNIKQSLFLNHLQFSDKRVKKDNSNH